MTNDKRFKSIKSMTQFEKETAYEMEEIKLNKTKNNRKEKKRRNFSINFPNFIQS